ncbi:MAG: UdgX family uracil-DNA binding protein [Thermoanaerobaculia bacterium]
MREVVFEPTLAGWRDVARRLVAERVPPEEVVWNERTETPDLFTAPPVDVNVDAGAPAPELRVPRAFVELAGEAAEAEDPERWRVLYSVLWRLAEGDHDIMRRSSDADVQRLRKIAASKGARSAKAAPREKSLPADGGATPYVPDTTSLDVLVKAVQKCKGCDLYKYATQAVFGEGSAKGRVVLVGEVPGDQEDLQGRPFVGPAGAVLDRALAEVGLSRNKVYVTNVVKHFKFERTPKRRIHQTPTSGEIQACRPWLFKELEIIKPEVLVCLGATASKALLGPSFRLLKQRGEFLESSWAPRVLATYHPSAVLRADDDAGKEKIYSTLVADLKKAAAAASV